jgi:hypothetical protein
MVLTHQPKGKAAINTQAIWVVFNQ